MKTTEEFKAAAITKWMELNARIGVRPDQNVEEFTAWWTENFPRDEPNQEVWAEIDGLLEKLNSNDFNGSLELVRARFPVSETRWLIVTRSGDAMDGWVPVGSSGWKPLSTIQDQLHELATERGLFAPSLEEIMLSLEEMGEDGRAQFSAFVTAQAAKAAKGGG